MDEAVEIVRGWLCEGGVHQIVTPNAEFVMRARSDYSFRELISHSALSVPDGAGLLLAGRLLGTPLREQVTGTDLVVRLARLCAEDGRRLFLLGAAEGVACEAARRLLGCFPELRIAGAFAGSPGPDDEPDVRARIAAAAPVDVLLVAYGAPAQDYWIARNQNALGVPVAMGVGGVFDFVAGRVPRAPAWLRRIGLDWAFRLALQPWRWRRQLAIPRFVGLAMVTALRRRLAPQRTPSR
jgi:N-acetylglucosaminyldiphosphoundecaprenol N-acetyl-beta-D-mannosaminyltransferase